MDLGVFTESNFVPAQWINGVINSSPDESLESLLSTLSMKLHIMSQDYTDQLETAMVESMSTMPRILNEIKKIEVQLNLTENEMNSVSTQLNTFDERNFSGVEDLSRLDMVKTNMERCKSTLEEHAQWSQLVREAQSLLNEHGSCTTIANHIETMFRSLEILKNLPGHEERQNTCELMKSSLLISLGPKVKKEISSNDFTLLQDYLFVYKKLGKEKELEEQYVTARPIEIVASWSQISGSLSKDIVVYLSRVSQFIALEELSIIELFGTDRGAALLCDILQRVFKPLHTAFALKESSSLTTSEAFECYSAVNDFVTKMLHLLVKAGHPILTDTLRCFFSSLVSYLPIYIDNEEKNVRCQLSQLISSVAFGSGSVGSDEGQADVDDALFGLERDATEEYNAYSEGLVRVADGVHLPFEAALHRAVHFVGGVKCKTIVKSIISVLADSAKLIAGLIDDLAIASCVAPLGIQLDRTNTSAAAISLSQQLDSGELDSRLLVSCSLRALQAVGRFRLRSEQIEQLTTHALLELSNSLFPNGQAIINLSQCQVSTVSCAAFTFLQDSSEASEFRSFLTTVGSTQRDGLQNMFSSIMDPSLKRLQSSACGLLFSLSVALSDKLFSSIVADECWADPGPSTDTLLPQSVITQVGEHLLSLVQELEAFASSDALEDLLLVREQTVGLAVQSAGWQQMSQVLKISDNAVLARICQKVSSGKALDILSKSLFANLSAVSSGDDVQAASFSASSNVEESDGGGAVLAFVNEWLVVIMDASVGMLLSKVAQITILTSGGAAQLLSDLNYMSNVASAMGIRPHPLLLHVKMLLEMRAYCSEMLESADLTLSTTGGDVQSFANFDRRILQAIVRGEGRK